MSSRKSVLITGCSDGGIGAALAEAFQEKGYHVFATLRTPSKIGPRLAQAEHVTVLTLDVLSSESIAAAVKSVAAVTDGKLDVLVNNSGQGSFMPALDISIEESKRVFDLNFWAPMAMLQAFAPLLIKAQGCLVNNTSANALLPLPLTSIYNSSKAALAIASETWRHELQPFGVRVITLYTCGTKTKFFDNNHFQELPENSRYSDVKHLLQKLTDGSLQENGITSRQYATNVVRQVEKGTVGEVWEGKDALLARIGCHLFPQSILDSIVQGIVPISADMAKAAKKKGSQSKGP